MPEGNQHLSIAVFGWINEQTQQVGQATRASMYDWVVNKKGKAYVRGSDGTPIYLFGAVSPLGDTFLRTIRDQKWTDDLLSLPEC